MIIIELTHAINVHCLFSYLVLFGSLTDLPFTYSREINSLGLCVQVSARTARRSRCRIRSFSWFSLSLCSLSKSASFHVSLRASLITIVIHSMHCNLLKSM